MVIEDWDMVGKSSSPTKYLDKNNCQYLKNNFLVFRVSVEVPDHKPWLEQHLLVHQLTY